MYITYVAMLTILQYFYFYLSYEHVKYSNIKLLINCTHLKIGEFTVTLKVTTQGWFC